MLFNKKPSLAWYLGRKPYKTINTSYDQKYFKVLEEIVGVMIQHYRKNPWHKTPLEISEIYEIAYMFTGYLEDFVSEIGFWQAIRNKNKEIYGTPVPLFLKPSTPEFDAYDEEDLNIEDICLMLWYNLGLYYDITFNPQNRGIRLMAEDILEVMTDHYDTLDGTSFYDDFLHIEKGEDWGKIKQKIHWFAYKSPFVQLECHRSRRDRKTSDATDWNLPQLEQILKDEDIFFRTSMRWHGQLCVDMFADILRGNTQSIQQIREFAKRDIAIYYLKSQDNKHFHFINTFTEQLYEVPKHSISGKTASKKYYFAGFVRWDDHWEMNGSIFGGWDDASIANDMNEKFQGNFYYYDAGYKNQVNTTITEQHKAFTAAFGDDFAIAKTAAEFQQNLIKYDEKYYDLVLLDKSVSKEEYLKNNGMSILLRNHFPKNIPMTMYFNPKMGIEYIDNLHTIFSIMKKKFKDLTKDDSRELVGLIVDEGISAQCVKHLMEQVDFKTLYDHYGIKTAKEFEFMLRYYKADDFRVHPPRMNIFNLCKDKWDAIKFDNL